MSATLVRHRFSVADFERMVEAGILSSDDRLELLRGEVIEMSPIGNRHAACVNRLVAAFGDLLQQGIVLSVQNPIQLGDRSMPQPDLALLVPRADFYASGKPQPSDVLLLVEVADATVASDRAVKLPLYAEFGIRETWLADLTANRVTAYRDPSLEGYRTAIDLDPDGAIAPLAFPDLVLAIAGLLP